MRALIDCVAPERIDAALDALTPNALCSLPYLFECWANQQHQLPPLGTWMTWVILGGRGSGKTRAGAEWVRSQVEGARPQDKGKCRRVALVAETLDQARDIMVFGESGILACSPADRMPVWQAERRRLVWANGAQAQIFSASDPESLRGPQFDAAWADEMAKWKKGREAWDMLQFALRLGREPQQVVTTTPRANVVLKEILGDTMTRMTTAPTWANKANLAPGFLASIRARYDGTVQGRQELDGEMPNLVEGALWDLERVDGGRVALIPEFDRIVVAVDPPVTGGRHADDCGIIVAGVEMTGPPKDWRATVIEDCSVAGASPQDWAVRAINAYHRHKADRLVAEVNQGGDLVATLVRQIDPMVAYRGVRATRGKAVRAEPVAMLYEQGRVAHLGVFRALEDQMAAMTSRGYAGKGSPDRVDALVWAITDLMIEPAQRFFAPHIRPL